MPTKFQSAFKDSSIYNFHWATYRSWWPCPGFQNSWHRLGSILYYTRLPCNCHRVNSPVSPHTLVPGLQRPRASDFMFSALHISCQEEGPGKCCCTSDLIGGPKEEGIFQLGHMRPLLCSSLAGLLPLPTVQSELWKLGPLSIRSQIRMLVNTANSISTAVTKSSKL